MNKLESDATNPIRSRLMSMLKQNRQELYYYLEGVTDEMLDFSPDMDTIETIGTLLYHIAGVDWSWVFEDIDGKEMDYEKWKYGFATRFPDIEQFSGQSLDFYMDLIDQTREQITARLMEFDDQSLQQVFIADDTKEFTVEWLIYHLVRHEAKHMGQISLLKRLYRLEHKQ